MLLRRRERSLIQKKPAESPQSKSDRAYGLDALSAMERAGARQRDIEQEGITADYLQFEKERKYPYEQLAFQQSLLTAGYLLQQGKSLTLSLAGLRLGL